jgi:hypothetical protein
MAKVGKHQISVKRGPLKALGESNFARDTEDYEVDSNEPARCGYIEEPYVHAGPATDNGMIRNTGPSRGSLGNDGTSRNSYYIQPEIVNADDNEPGDEGTGIPKKVGRGSIERGQGGVGE